jgi:hypothetical protein
MLEKSRAMLEDDTKVHAHLHIWKRSGNFVNQTTVEACPYPHERHTLEVRPADTQPVSLVNLT